MNIDDSNISLEQPLPSSMKFLPMKEICRAMGRSYSSIDNDVIAKRLPPPIKLGGKLKSWPKHEVDVLIAARMAGKSNEEIKELVISLITARSDLFKSLSKLYSTAE